MYLWVDVSSGLLFGQCGMYLWVDVGLGVGVWVHVDVALGLGVVIGYSGMDMGVRGYEFMS